MILLYSSSLLPVLLLIQTIISYLTTATKAAQDFDPYQLNGGLVSAIAGKDYVILASDTRLTDGGYEILTRNHIQSRLWAVSAPPAFHGLVGKDGSVVIPKEEGHLDIVSSNRHDPYKHDEDTTSSSMRNNKNDEEEINDGKSNIIYHTNVRYPITFIASSGCSSDCEALKRQIRTEIQGHITWNYGGDTLSTAGIANVLGQTLYSRRTFPFYSFCIVGGLDFTENGNGDGSGVVHIYDAIGSHERVAVAAAGTGKEMLQPILDRFLSNERLQHTIIDDDSDEADPMNDTKEQRIASNEESSVELLRDGRAVKASDQRIGLKLIPPVETHVKCSVKTAVDLLVRGYRSVSEREISVGDEVVVCVIRRLTKEENKKSLNQSYCSMNDGEHIYCQNGCVMQTLRFPLKKH